MSHIPRLFCVHCQGYEMVIEKNGVTVETIAKMGPYYKIKADLWRCPGCHNEVLIPGQQPFIEHFMPGYNEVEADYRVCFSEILLG